MSIHNQSRKKKRGRRKNIINESINKNLSKVKKQKIKKEKTYRKI